MIRNSEELALNYARLDELASEKEGYRERLEFYKSVFGFLMEAREKSGPIQAVPSEEDAVIRLKEGFPLMDRLKIEPDIGQIAENYDEILKLAEKGTRAGEDVFKAVKGIREKVDDFPDFLLHYFRESRADGVLEKEPDEVKEFVSFGLHIAVKPFYESYAIRCVDLAPLADWEMGYCPVCGGGAAVSVLKGEEGKRILLCCRCGYEWKFKRVRCPFCDNTDNHKLQYIRFEDAPSYRIDVCEECKGYLKGIDSRWFPGLVTPEAEDLATPHLDLIAEKEGYSKKAPNIFGLFR